MTSTLALSLLSSADAYIASLTIDDKTRQYFSDNLKNASAENVIDTVRQIQESYLTRPKIEKFVTKMGDCMARLERFFRIIDIAIQANPTISAVVWAGLRLVFQLAGDFSSFFEKLATMIDHMILALPDYDQYLRLFQEDEPLKASIVKVYQDLMDFLRIATQIFFRKSKPRPMMKLAMDITWTPFDQRFDSIVKRFKDHHEQVRSKALLSSMESTQKAHREADLERKRSQQDREVLSNLEKTTTTLARHQFEERREKAIRKLLDWLDPKDFQDVIDRISGSRHPQTGVWVLQSNEYRDFVTWSRINTSIEPDESKVSNATSNSLPIGKEESSTMVGSKQRIRDVTEMEMQNNFLWIFGNPGCGKTWLTTLLLDDLSQESSIDENQERQQRTVAHYFCNYTERTSTSDILRSILAQILYAHKNNQDVVDVFCLSYTKSITSLASSNLQLMHLLQLTLRQLRDVFIVIDGLDECMDRAEIAPFLRKLSQEQSSVKILVLARDSDTVLRPSFALVKSLEITGTLNCPDIFTYSASIIDDLWNLVGLREAGLSKDDLARKFATASNGMFLWVKLTMDWLSSPFLRQKDRIKIIHNIGLPEGMETLYSRIFETLSLQPKTQRDFAARILTWTCWSHEQLELDELEAVLNFRNHDEFSSIVRVGCAGLIEITPFSKVQFIHLSAKEFIESCETYLASQTISLIGLFHHASDGTNYLAMNCLEYLSDEVPGEPLSGKIDHPCDRDVVRRQYPFLKYATYNWIAHLDGTKHTSNKPLTANDLKLLVYVRAFLTSRNRILMWAEAQYTLGIPLAWESFNRLLSWADAVQGRSDNTINKDLVEITKIFVTEFQNMQVNFDRVLGLSPHKIWSGITDWSSPDGPLSSGSSRVIRCTPVAPDGLEDHKPTTLWDTDSPVAVVSELSVDGKNLLVCSAWASRRFSSLIHSTVMITKPTNDHETSIPKLDFKSLASGWILRLETWDLVNRKRRDDTKDLQLDPAQVEPQLRKSVCYSSFWDQNGKLQRRLRFGFPMALSPKQNFIAVLSTVFRIVKHTTLNCGGNWWIKNLENQQTDDSCYHDFRIKFSPCDRFVAYHIARRYREPPYLNGGENIEIFDLDHSTSNPIWSRDVPCFFNKPLIKEVEAYESIAESLNLAFHPTLPLIAWAGPMMGTYISDFINNMIGLGRNVTHQPIGRLRFSNCGRLLLGTDTSGGLACFTVTEVMELGILSLPAPLDSSSKNLSERRIETTPQNLSTVPQQILRISDSLKSAHQQLGVGDIQCGGPGAGDSKSVVALMQSSEGEVSLQRMRDEIEIEQRRIASIPLSLTGPSTETRVLQHSNMVDGCDDQLTVVLSKVGRSWYTQSTSEERLGRDPVLYIRPTADLGPWQSAPITRGSKRKFEIDSDEAFRLLGA